MANVANGQIYPIPPEINLNLGETLLQEMIPQQTVDAKAAALRAALTRDETIIGVSSEVAQQLALGQRELERRTRRRARARRS